ncbi:stage V sporulation protein D [Virgibacillus flavescens]|uniref:stage V sporulation protein D n=1 Tax=Virgibacillus flavescens TaxID=1611422 RepID=UPI003D34C71B
MKRVSTVIVRKRIVAVFLIGLFVFAAINIRLGYVQFFLADELIQKANDLWSRDVAFEAERGRILDVNGDVLTKNVSAPTVIIAPSQVKNPRETAEKLANVLGISTELAYEKITQNSSQVTIRPQGIKISKKQEKALQTYNLEGVYLAKDSKRYYPYGDDLSHVLGFTGIDNQGLMGLELYYDDKLSGTPGSLSYYSTGKGGRLKEPADVYKPPVDGLTLKTTINSKVQTIIERELDLAEAKYSPDGAIAIAVNPKTGGIMGMSSRPNFKPGQYKKFDSTVYSRNLPIWSTYEPGSTFKIITLAAALEENAVNLTEDTFNDDGDIKVGGKELHCWKSGGHGHQTYLEVVQNSCNPGFVNLGMKLGKEKLFSYIRDFGFGKETGIDLQGESNGILFKPENVGPLELATTAFGQGVSVTPIQQVMAVAAAINGGNLMEPYIAKEWIDPVTKEVVSETEPNLIDSVISESTSEKIRYALENVVANGTGRPAYVEGYRIGGKTGTAQKVGPDGSYMQNNYVLSFVGFAPADDPEIVVYVAIDNPKNTVQFGGVVVAPIVGTIIGDSLSAMGVEKRTDGLAKKYQWPEQPRVSVPDLIGLKKSEIVEYQTNLSIKASGSGNYIIDQEPKPGTNVNQGSSIRIYLSDKK